MAGPMLWATCCWAPIPVSSTVESVATVEATLQEILQTFKVDHLMPHCVLSHIDVQADVEKQQPGSTALWFQSIAGCDSANQTFDLSVEKMVKHARKRTGQFGLYFETGQGADFTNGHSHGFDMVMHESRKYGFARALTAVVAAQRKEPWVHVNDVAGFIGPEVFRTREQLVRCCLEDIVMGKLHGLCIGLDVCSTLHMDVSLDDLDWCMDQIMPACPAYLMALPTKIDPMLGYLTTGYQDHVRLRERFGLRVNDAMARFFQELGVLDGQGNPAKRFGDPAWIYLEYCRRKGDARSEDELRREARQKIAEVRSRGVFLADGYGNSPSQLQSQLAESIQRIYNDAKLSIWAELPEKFEATIPRATQLKTRSRDRQEYILHPTTGEELCDDSHAKLTRQRAEDNNQYNAQVVLSDGLNALAISEPEHVIPFLEALRDRLREEEFRLSPSHLVVRAGRVRAGYRIGETLFGQSQDKCTLIHLIGERPGTGHRTFSVYFTRASGQTWGQPGKVDHDITKVVSGIALTALHPIRAAEEVARILRQM